MLNKLVTGGFIGLTLLCFGCTMCCHPYDYCGPVYGWPGTCDSNIRAGSIQPSSERCAKPEDAYRESILADSPSSVQQSAAPGEYEGATQLLSVTDRKLESQDETNTSERVAHRPRRSVAR
ncbi:MAG: hypothetical protein ACWGMZ_11205 [Thermoguttaceae bacterium]